MSFLPCIDRVNSATTYREKVALTVDYCKKVESVLSVGKASLYKSLPNGNQAGSSHCQLPSGRADAGYEDATYNNKRLCYATCASTSSDRWVDKGAPSMPLSILKGPLPACCMSHFLNAMGPWSIPIAGMYPSRCVFTLEINKTYGRLC